MSRVIGLIIFGSLQKICNFAHGEMAEWSIAAVLKTVEVQASGGSNPSLSAALLHIKLVINLIWSFFIFLNIERDTIQCFLFNFFILEMPPG